MMLLKLVKGSTTITLSGETYIAGCTYIPRTPEDNVTATASSWRNGGEVSAVVKRNVTESATVILQGTASQMLAQARAIEALLPTEDAQRRAASTKLYVEYRQESTGDTYRAEVLAARVEWPNQPLTPWLASGAVSITIIWQRRWYWEDTTLRTLALTNGNGADVTAGLTVFNHDDSYSTEFPLVSHDNWVSIAAAAVTGVIPAPAHIEITNNQTLALAKICIGHNVQANPATLAHILEGEASTIAGAGDITDAGASGGKWRTASWTGAITGTKIFKWTLSAAQLLAMGGNYFRVLARVSGQAAGMYVRVGLWGPTSSALTLFAAAEEVEAQATPLQDWGVIQLPPFTLTKPYDLALAVEMRCAGTDTLDLDFLQLTPIDSWRQVRQIGYQLAATDVYVDEGNGAAYVQDASGYQYPILIADGDPIMLWPGYDQRLYFLFGGASMDPAWTFGVKVKYRPRRLTL